MFSAANIAGGRRRIVTPPANTGLVDFTGADGSTFPSDFTTMGSAGTVIADIRSNRGALELVTASAARIAEYWSNSPATADVQYIYDFSFPVQKGVVIIFSCMDDGATTSGTAEPYNGYFVAISVASSASGGAFYTNKRVNGTNTGLNSAFSQTITAGVNYRIKLEHISATNTFRWRIWDSAGTEPSTWRSYTDSAITTPGKSRIGITGGAVVVTFDNATYTVTA